jgi:hypothetical protein
MKKITLLFLLLIAYTQGFAQSPTDNATDPTARDAADVISIFSGAYTDVAASDFNPNWGQAGFGTANAAFDPGTGNLVLAYPNFNYQGVQYGSVQNISAMEFLHVDIWVNGTFNPNVFVISSGGEIAHPVTNTGSGTWISVDIPVAGITGDLANAIQFKFDGGNGSTDAIYVDNLYFWKNPADPTADATLSDLQVGGASISGFSGATTSYTYELTVGTTTAPDITMATTTQAGASAVITQATAVPGDATVVVTASNSTDMETYTVSFVATLPGAAGEISSPDGEVLALLDNVSNGTATTFWNPSYFFGTSQGIVDLEGNNAVKMDFSVAGWGGGINNGSDVYTDVSAYGFVNFSYFAPTDAAGVNGHEVKFILIGGGASPGGTGAGEFSYTLKEAGQGGDADLIFDQWVNLSIPLSHFVNLGWATDNFFQFKLGSTSDLNTKVVYFDNMFFSTNMGTLGTDSISTFESSVYPNPSANGWNVNTPNTTIKSIQVFNLLGKRVLSQKANASNVTISTDGLASGIYLARITTELGTKTVKLLRD